MIRRHLALALALACGAALLVACGTGGSGSQRGGELNVATTQAWTGLNPHTPDQGSSIGIALGNLLYPSAFTIEPSLEPELNSFLLESAKLTSATPQQVVFEIRPEARWSDGAPITADDFAYLWKHMSGANPDVQVAATLGYDRISAVTGSNDGKTVTVDFKRPFGEWESLFSGILPAHYMKTLGDDVDAWNRGLALPATPPSGNAFQLAADPDESVMQFEPNPEWYGDRAELDGLTVRFIEDTSAVLQAVSSGEIDLALGLNATRSIVSQAEAIADTEASRIGTANIQFFAFQFARPLTRRPEIREAVATALDETAIVEAVFGEGAEDLLTDSRFCVPGTPAYTVPDGVIDGADPEEAQRMLESTGYEMGDDGYLQRNGETLVLSHSVSAADSVDVLVSQVAQDQLKQAGIKLEIEATPSSTYFSDVLIPGRYDTLTFLYPGSPFPAGFTAALFTCRGGYNFQRYCNPDVDDLFSRAAETLSTGKRQALLSDIDEVLWSDLSLVPMFSVPALDVISQRVDGVSPHPMIEWALAEADTWRVQ